MVNNTAAQHTQNFEAEMACLHAFGVGLASSQQKESD